MSGDLKSHIAGMALSTESRTHHNILFLQDFEICIQDNPFGTLVFDSYNRLPKGAERSGSAFGVVRTLTI
jgi:hypothetical protein